MLTPQRDGHVPTSPSATPEADLKRRRFLLALGAGSASAAAATQAIAAPVAQQEAAPQEQSRGYRETQHVRDYYASTRI
jgi:hypothetical protein